MRAARFAVLAFLLGGCAPAVRVTRDTAIAIPPRATWSFGGKDGAYSVDEADPRARSDSVQHRVERAIAYELDRRGFKRADPAAATFLVHFHIGARTETVRVRSDDPATCVADECRNAWNWRGWGSPEAATREIRYSEGSLLLDVVERSTGKLAWRGALKGSIDEQAEVASELARVVERVLRPFPGN